MMQSFSKQIAALTLVEDNNSECFNFVLGRLGTKWFITIKSLALDLCGGYDPLSNASVLIMSGLDSGHVKISKCLKIKDPPSNTRFQK